MWTHLRNKDPGHDKMRCRNAIKQIGPYVDGELTAADTKALREHLAECKGCSQRYSLVHGLVRKVSSLPAIVPTPEESYRLMNRLRREMSAPAAPRPAYRRIQVAATSISLLVIATVTGVSLVIWGGGGGPAPVSEEVALEGEGTGEALSKDTTEADLLGEETAVAPLAQETMARPALVTSEKDYSSAELAGYRNDLGTRLDFYSTYWYPTSGGASQTAALEEIQQDLTGDLALQAEAAGQNPDELEQAVTTVLEQAGDEPLLPCYAERAKIDGKDAWLISVSGPEDYLLFPDQQQPPAMALASLGGEESLKISESLLRQLAAWLTPNGSNAVLVPSNTLQDQSLATPDSATGEGTTTAPSGSEGETRVVDEQARVEEDFQSFLRRLVAQGTSLDVISALEGLNYEQVLMLLQGDWSSLASDGVNMSDFLTPPKRLWAVDCASNQVVWPTEN